MPKAGAKKNASKPHQKKSLFPRFIEALKERYHHVLQVIDDALASENLKDRIWAVEQILKRTKPEDEIKLEHVRLNTKPKSEVGVSKIPAMILDSKTIAAMNNEELLVAIKSILRNDPLPPSLETSIEVREEDTPS